MIRLALLLLPILLMCGCSVVEERHGDIQTPPATSSTSVATEDLITQKADAKARALVAASDVKAALQEQKAAAAELWRAKTAQERDQALADKAKADADAQAAHLAEAKAKADGEADRVALDDQRKAEVSGRLDRFYVLAVIVLAVAAFARFEGFNKLAGGLAAVSGALVIGPMTISWMQAHEALIMATVISGTIAGLAWHYRKKLGALSGVISNLEKAVDHLHLGGSWAWATSEVKDALVKSYQRVRGLASTSIHELEALLHFRSTTAPLNDVGVGQAPPAVKPDPIKQPSDPASAPVPLAGASA